MLICVNHSKELKNAGGKYVLQHIRNPNFLRERAGCKHGNTPGIPTGQIQTRNIPPSQREM